MTEQLPLRDIQSLIAAGEITQPEQVLGPDDKETLAEAGTAFTVNAVQYGDDGEFGPFWQVEAVVSGKPVSFRLSSHEGRDPFMSGLAGVITGGPIGGLRLKAYKGRNGHAFVTLEPA